MKKRLIEMVKPAMNLSPFERYLFAYNIAKKFKEYKENPEEKDQSRNLYSVLDGEYMVCVGFSVLLGDLLTKLGIENTPYSVGVDTGFDNVPNDAVMVPDDVQAVREGHARLEVNLVDPKYGINGIFIADPTWDNVLDQDTYNYALMTQDEYNGINRYNFLSFYDCSELFFVHSAEEFYYKSNIFLDRKIDKVETQRSKSLNDSIVSYKEILEKFLNALKMENENEYKEIYMLFGSAVRTKKNVASIERLHARLKKYVDKSNSMELSNIFKELDSKMFNVLSQQKYYKASTNEAMKDFIKDMLLEIAKIDSRKYAELMSKYDQINNWGFVVTDEVLKEFVFEAGEYILSKVNKPVSGEIFKAAITEVYRVTPGMDLEHLEEKVDETINYNMKRQRLCFPVRYKVLEDGTKVAIMNEENKFELGNSEEMKM